MTFFGHARICAHEILLRKNFSDMRRGRRLAGRAARRRPDQPWANLADLRRTPAARSYRPDTSRGSRWAADCAGRPLRLHRSVVLAAAGDHRRSAGCAPPPPPEPSPGAPAGCAYDVVLTLNG